jgi:hypothetical protein
MDSTLYGLSTSLRKVSLSNAETTSKRCWLLELPPELRETIYIYVVRSAQSSILLNFSVGSNDIPSQNPTGHPTFPLNLLLTTSQIYHEVRPLYFVHNAFSIYVRRRAGNEEWDYFLSPSFLDNRRQIHTLRITLFRWGPRDFFTEVLGPALEDCILNGRLRNLEIRVNQRWIECDEWIVRGSRNFCMLRRLLKDPYLERGVLTTGDLSEWEYWDSDSYVEKMSLKDVSSNLDGSYPGENKEHVFMRRNG